MVDANRLAGIAGGPAYLHLIEVPYTFQDINGFRGALVKDLAVLGIPGDVYIQSTLTGRLIEVHALNPAQLPDSFAHGIPADAFTIVKAEGLITEG